MSNSKPSPGIRPRHSRSCASKGGNACNCSPAWEAGIYSKADQKKIRRTFTSRREAEKWLNRMRKERDETTLRAPAAITLNAAADQWLNLARNGGVVNRSGDPYKPSAVRGYEQALRLRILPDLGAHKLSEIARGDVQRLVGKWQGEGLNASTIGNSINALRAIYRDADVLTRGAVPHNPTRDLRLPARRSKRDRIASVDEATRLLDALPPAERALWATAFFAGLRHGELRALRWEAVDLAAGMLNVEDGWDQQEGRVDPKSRAGIRRVPIVARLNNHLLDHAQLTNRSNGLVFGRTETTPFHSGTVNSRANRAWEATKLEPIGLHEARHTAASFWIAAGVNPKTISTYMGHASIAFTHDRYGHLLPGSEAESVELIDAFLERADTTARLRQIDGRAPAE